MYRVNVTPHTLTVCVIPKHVISECMLIVTFCYWYNTRFMCMVISCRWFIMAILVDKI